MYDAIVVGARCAGSPTAMNLARAGYRVLVVDRSHFPSDTLSTHALTGDASMRLMKWGLLDRVIAANGRPPTDYSIQRAGGVEVRVPGMYFSPRRTVLDAILVDAAREAGAEVREGCSMVGLVRDADGTVTGVRLQSDGVVSEETARIVIGADGRNSHVARDAGAAVYNELPALAFGYYSYFEGFPVETVEIHHGDGEAAFAFPTSHNQVCIAVMQRAARFDAFRADTENEFRKTLERVGLGERYAAATRVEDWKGAKEPPNLYRMPYGPGWALVGDAGYVKDPVLGQGVNDAFRDADLLSGALIAFFGGERDFETAMAGYQRARDEATAQVYQFNYEFSKLAVTPGHLQQLAGVAAAKMAEAAGR